MNDLSEKKLLIVGAGRGQVDLIKTAQKMGCKVIVATHSYDYPGVPLADKVCLADIRDHEAVCKIAEDEGVDGVATACLDTGIEAVGYTCDKLNLSGISFVPAQRANDKLLMKRALVAAGVPTAKYSMVGDKQALYNVLEEMTLPLIIKAVDLQGSRGIYVCETKEEVISYYDLVMEQTQKDYCIIEEFIRGVEFGAEAFVQNGEVIFVLPNGKRNHFVSTGIPIGHFAPMERDEAFLEKASRIVSDAIAAIGFNNCAVNVDLIERDGEIYIIELTGRVGANCLPELVSLYYGINYYEMIVMCALGLDARKVFDTRAKTPIANSSCMLTMDKSGTVKSINNRHPKDDKNVYSIVFFIKEGDEVRSFTNSNDCIGQVIVTGKTLADCEKTIEQIKENIDIELD